MDEDVAFAIVAHKEAEAARRVEPFDPPSDLDCIRRDFLLLGFRKDCMPNHSASATGGLGFGRIVGTRTHECTVTREDGFLKMNR